MCPRQCGYTRYAEYNQQKNKPVRTFLPSFAGLQEPGFIRFRRFGTRLTGIHWAHSSFQRRTVLGFGATSSLPRLDRVLLFFYYSVRFSGLDIRGMRRQRSHGTGRRARLIEKKRNEKRKKIIIIMCVCVCVCVWKKCGKCPKTLRRRRR